MTRAATKLIAVQGTNSPSQVDGFDYALLGLRANEARVSVIRRAALQVARRINGAANGPQEGSEMRMHLAVSTYRLLDPRRRNRLVERVQLSVFGEDDMEAQRRSRRSFLVSKSNCQQDQRGPRTPGISGSRLVSAELVA